MFSGIIDAMGEVKELMPVPGGVRLVLRADDYWSNLSAGASVAVDGVCLTITQFNRSEAAFDVVAETLRRSTLGELKPGSRVNLQKSMMIGDRIDGHFVQGHVDAIATIARIEESAAESMRWFRLEGGDMSYIIPKGSVAIDGISLTIATVKDGLFSVALIPTTLERTTLGTKQLNDRVNVETDIIARTVVRQLQFLSESGMTGMFLRK